MKVLEADFLEPVAFPGVGRASASMGTKYRDGAVTCRTFGPGVVMEAPDGGCVMVPWGNVRWVKVDGVETKGKER